MRQDAGDTDGRVLPFTAAGRKLIRRPEARADERGQVLLFTGIRYERMPDAATVAAFRQAEGGQPSGDHRLGG